jgi:hypothetical protein
MMTSVSARNLEDKGMIKIGASETQLKAAGMVARSVDLLKISLNKSRFLNNLNEEKASEIKLHLEAKIQKSKFAITKRSSLLVITCVKVNGFREGSATEKEIKPSMQIEATYQLEFRIPKEEIPEKIKKFGLPAFAQFNGLYICWPYFRQHVSYLCAQANIQGVTLPALTVSAKAKPQSQKEISPKIHQEMPIRSNS